MHKETKTDRMKQKKYRFGGYIVLLVGVLFCSGCGGSVGKNIAAGMQQIEEHQYDEALTSFEVAAQNKEDSQQIERGKGIACIGMADYENAIVHFKQALSYSDIRLDEMDYDLNYYLADAYMKAGDNERAMKIYNAILELEPKEVYALFLRGKIYLHSGDYEHAVADFTKALQYDGNNYDLRIEVAGQLKEAGYEEEGNKYLSDFLSENEKKLSDYDKGRIYYYLCDFENARDFLEKAKKDDNQNTILILGKTYEQLGDFNYATSVYKNYLADHADAAVIFNQLGLCKIQAGEYADALQAFTDAAAIAGNGMDQTLAFNQIVANEYLGDFKQAAVLMKAYLKKYPDDEDGKREYEFLLTR